MLRLERVGFPVWVEVVGADVGELVGARESEEVVGSAVAVTVSISRHHPFLVAHPGATAFPR
jgi:hypothetical protein